ncbi:GNAT family N-acetyltransferase [Aquibacillus halophilus]|uniref:GNAT family N-acetyltransferase n=1 Tax=Aquibacillus halophilus TaxID=930132 RepID=A0A6A8D797_9BACI|nr:GNAT family N-acetyltransferase [Aquibacillus halophilus]MRH41454.1 GNAT family N-acetyltransferase [Aquibacillus halophilus]
MGILKSASKEELIKANQRSLMDFFHMTSKKSDVIHFLKGEGIEGLYSSIPIRIVNRIILTDPNSKYLDSEVENISKFYEKKSSPLYWEVWPENSPDKLEETLLKQNFHYAGEYPAMGMKLDQLVEEDLKGLEIKRVENKKQAFILADLFKEIYQLPDTAREDFLNTVLLFDQDLINYLGYEDGEPVCMSSVYYYAGVAGIYNVGTKKDYCRKGYGRKVTAKPLMDASEKGYKYAILQSSEQGEKVYQRMGFEELCRVKSFKK